MVFPSEEITVNEETSVYDDDLRSPAASSGQLEKDRKQRREIANSNERRRMQSINAGFQTLRSLLPQSTTSAGGSGSSSSSAEKLSKATILQQASAHIKKLDDEKRHLAARNDELQRALALATTVKAAAVSSQHRPQPQEMQLAVLQASAAKRKKRDTECSDEGIAMAYSAQPGCSDEAPSPPTTTSGAESAELRRELSDLRASLDAERQRSGALERTCGLLQERLHGSSLHAAGAASVATAAAVMPLLGLRYPAATGHECCLAEPAPAVDLRQTSMSRRNLQMIVEAIHHLEGGGDIEGGAAVASPAGVTSSPSSSVEDTGSSCNSRDCGSGGTASAPAEAAQLACSSSSSGGAGSAAAASGLQRQQQQHLYYRPTFMAQLPCALEGSALVSRR